MSFTINCDWCHRYIKQAQRKEMAEIISRDEDVICKSCEEAVERINTFKQKIPEKMRNKIERLMADAEKLLRDEIQRLANAPDGNEYSQPD